MAAACVGITEPTPILSCSRKGITFRLEDWPIGKP
jgi:hypothetical protein